MQQPTVRLVPGSGAMTGVTIPFLKKKIDSISSQPA
jgi:hypothetical protein